jgi:hypothetical protein
MKIVTRRALSAAFLLPLAARPASATALFSHLPSARVIGAAYIRSHPADDFDISELPPDRPAIAARVRDDFANGRIVTVDGWMLSITEARLCALAYLTT